jgi:lysozyme family protein
MYTVDQMIEDIIRREGGYNDQENDKGGATNQGISLRYAKGVGLDLDGDGDTDKDDIQMVTPEVAAGLYKKDFFIYPKIDRLPEEIQPLLFDSAVNHGPPRAIMLLQKVLNLAGFGPMGVDGVIGPKTRAVAEKAQNEMGNFLNNAIVDERINFYKRIVANDPSQQKWFRGWMNRANEFWKEV